MSVLDAISRLALFLSRIVAYSVMLMDSLILV